MARRLSSVLGLALVLALGLATVSRAEEDYKKMGVRLRAIYVMPTENVDSRLGNAVKLEDNIVPEIDFEYFFTKKISAEVIAAVTKHEVRLNGDAFGSTYLLPPTLTLKYHPFAGNQVSPYVGVGINATFPFESRSNGGSNLKIDNSVGWAAQAGFDLKIKDNLYFNFDYKYVNVDTNAKISGVKYDLDINPHLFGVGVGYRF